MARIITLNIGYGMFLDDLLTYIDRHIDATDIFCFQEVDASTREVLDAVLSTKYAPVHVTKFDKDEKFLLSTYIDRRLTLLDTKTLLSNVEDVGLALTCRLQDSTSGMIFAVTNVHGFPRPGAKLDTEKRLLQSTQLISESEKEMCHVYLGDFNLLPEARSVKMFAGHGFRDLIKECGITNTRNKVVWERWPGNEQMFADYVFVKNAPEAECHLKTEDDIISDHLPLVFDISLQSLRYFKANTKLVSNSGNTAVSQVLNAAN